VLVGQGVFALPEPKSPSKQPGVYGPVFELSERDPRYMRPNPSYGIIRILVQEARIRKGGKLWSPDKIRKSAIDYLSIQWPEATANDYEQSHVGVGLGNVLQSLVVACSAC
jgi:hypothetical protein